jgi:hypothetical protein
MQRNTKKKPKKNVKVTGIKSIASGESELSSKWILAWENCSKNERWLDG